MHIHLSRSWLLPVLIFAPAWLLGIDACNQDQDGDGWTTEQGDCDDGAATSFPGAEEVCDGADDDCDGETDEGFALSSWYLDADRDGFGDESITAELCGMLAGYSADRGDCLDSDAAVHPGASDASDDGLDSDCGGTEDADPHVGLSDASSATIQAALDGAADGQTVWVGSGTWLEHDLSMFGRAVALRSTHGTQSTVIDAQGAGRVMLFQSGETAASLLDGFTITGGYASGNCTPSGTACDAGGGLLVYNASPTLTHNTISGNVAAERGGGVARSGSTAILTQNTISANLASGGGGLALSSSSATMTENLISGNSAIEEGGGLWIYQGSPVVVGNIISENRTGFMSLGRTRGGADSYRGSIGIEDEGPFFEAGGESMPLCPT